MLMSAITHSYFLHLLMAWFACVTSYFVYLFYDTWFGSHKDARCPHYNMLTNLSILIQVLGTGWLLRCHVTKNDLWQIFVLPKAFTEVEEEDSTPSDKCGQDELLYILVLNAMLTAVYVTFFVVLLADNSLLKEFTDKVGLNVFVVLNNVVHVLPLIVLRECILLRFTIYSRECNKNTSIEKQAYYFWLRIIIIFWLSMCLLYGLRHANILYNSNPPVRPDVWRCYSVDRWPIGLLYGAVFVLSAYFANKLMYKTLLN